MYVSHVRMKAELTLVLQSVLECVFTLRMKSGAVPSTMLGKHVGMFLAPCGWRPELLCSPVGFGYGLVTGRMCKGSHAGAL